MAGAMAVVGPGGRPMSTTAVPIRDQTFDVFPVLHRCYCGFERIDRSQEESDTFWAEHRAMHRKQKKGDPNA